MDKKWTLLLRDGLRIFQLRGTNRKIKTHIKKRTAKRRERKFGFWEKVKERKQAENKTKAQRKNAEGIICTAEL